MDLANKVASYPNSIRNELENSGVRLNDWIFLTPFQGARKSLEIKRTRINIGLKLPKSSSSIPLEGLRNQRGGVTLELLSHPTKHLNEKYRRFIVKSLNGDPFKLNGAYTTFSYLERGDLLEIGYNKLLFSASPIELKKKNWDEKVESFLHNPRNIQNSLNILLEGPTGTGKSSLARDIHEMSERYGRFVHLNLSAIPESLLESELFGHTKGSFTGAHCDRSGAFKEADGGTLFLDEIDSLPLSLQVKLLLFLDTKTFRKVGGRGESSSDTRLIFASGQPLNWLMRKGKIRQDFYFRLKAGFTLKLSPLENQPRLIEDCILQFCAKKRVGIEQRLLEFYKGFPWPGNYRQLISHLEKKLASTSCKKLVQDRLEFELESSSLPFLDSDICLEDHMVSMYKMRKGYAKKVFSLCHRDYDLSTKILGISRGTLTRLLESKVS